MITRVGTPIVVIAAVVAVATYHRRDPTPTPILSDVDIGFAQDMSVHHQQAVTLADMLVVDAEPDVRTLADQIRTKQTALMASFMLRLNAPPLPYP